MDWDKKEAGQLYNDLLYEDEPTRKRKLIVQALRAARNRGLEEAATFMFQKGFYLRYKHALYNLLEWVGRYALKEEEL